MSNNSKYIYSGVIGVLKHEGVISLILRGYSYLLQRIFIFDDYYIIHTDLDKFKNDCEADFLPKTNDFYWQIISTNREADELAVNGFDFTAYELNLRASLDRGASVFCFFVGKEIAHIVCIADNLIGKDTIDFRPFNVDFQNGDVVTGRAFTVPKYRRLRLRAYSGYLLRRFFKEKGYVRPIGTMGVKNYPALANSARYHDTAVVAKCRYIKILWFKYFKEIEIGPFTMKEILEQRPDYIKTK